MVVLMHIYVPIRYASVNAELKAVAKLVFLVHVLVSCSKSRAPRPRGYFLRIGAATWNSPCGTNNNFIYNPVVITAEFEHEDEHERTAHFATGS
jgi:hypothetical protein